MEWNWKIVLLGMVFSIFFAMSSTYIGLYAGMTVSASIPAAVLSVIFLGKLRRQNILEHNIVQTIASAGESLAAGIIFTMPALLLMNIYDKHDNPLPWWLVSFVALFGGIFGIIAMIWVRRPLIVDRDKELTYPEGRACARMLQLFAKKGASLAPLIIFAIIGAIMKVLSGILGVVNETSIFFTRTLGMVKTTVDVTDGVPKEIPKGIKMGGEISTALLAVGVIIGFNASILVLIGGLINLTAMPLYMDRHPDWLIEFGRRADDPATYMGIGAMVVAAFSTLIQVGLGIISQEIKRSRMKKEGNKKIDVIDKNSPTEQDMKIWHQVLIAIICTVAVFILYSIISPSIKMSLTATLAIAVASGFFALVASYTVGQVGSTSNPVSGMTISGLLFCCLILLPFASQLLAGDANIANFLSITEAAKANAASVGKVILLVVAGVICCAACTAGAVSQDLKTGWLLKGTPRRQQWAMVLGVIAAAFILAPFINLLHQGLGIGKRLQAPQAEVFKGIVESFLLVLRGESHKYTDMMTFGAAFGVIICVADYLLKRGKKSFRLYPMAVAVGIYLGFALSVPITIGGLIALYVTKKVMSKENELPFIKGKDDDERNIDLTPRREYVTEVEAHYTIPAAGLIAGEAFFGIIMAAIVAFAMKFPSLTLPLIGVIQKDVKGNITMEPYTENILKGYSDWYSFGILVIIAVILLFWVRKASKKSFHSI